MFSGWQTFYQLMGSAAGELIGLLFIVATLNRGQQQPGSELGQRLFTTPTVVHLTMVLIVSGLALAPGVEQGFTSLIMMLCASVGFTYAFAIAARLRRLENPTHWSDFWCYGAAPVAVYVALAAAAVCAFARVPHTAYAMGLTLMALLIAAVRNAWDLVTWLAPRRPE